MVRAHHPSLQQNVSMVEHVLRREGRLKDQKKTSATEVRRQCETRKRSRYKETRRRTRVKMKGDGMNVRIGCNTHRESQTGHSCRGECGR